MVAGGGQEDTGLVAGSSFLPLSQMVITIEEAELLAGCVNVLLL